MAVENIPWVIKGGKHSEFAARRVLFHATGGAEGVSSIGDMRVLQQSVAAGSVKVTPGSCVMVNRYPGALNESYDGRNASDTTVTIAANGSGSTRYDLVIARVDDWNYAGQQATPGTLPTDTVPAFKLAVIQGVASTTKKASQLNLGYPAIALARIAIPAATSAITQAMITDLREKAVPQRRRVLNTRALVIGEADSLDATGVAGEQWPNVAGWTVEVPEWATRVRMVASWNGVKEAAGSSRYGVVWIKMGNGTATPFQSQMTGWDNSGATQILRRDFGLSDDVAIPAVHRGTSITFLMMGRSVAGSGTFLLADEYTSVVLDLEFLEAPTEDV